MTAPCLFGDATARTGQTGGLVQLSEPFFDAGIRCRDIADRPAAWDCLLA